MATTADLRVGAVLRFNGDACLVLESEHRTPGNLRAFYQVKMRNLRSGKTFEQRFRSGETIDLLRVERRDYQYLYKDGESFIFMNPETYDQFPVSEAALGEQSRFLKEGDNVQIAFNDTEIVSADLPSHVNLIVTYTEPGVRGDTATNVTKPATLETGAIIQVPIFVNEGDRLRIDTRTGAYIERVKN